MYHYFRHGHEGTSHKNSSQGDIFPQHKFDFIEIATLYSDSPAPEMKLTVHVDQWGFL